MRYTLLTIPIIFALLSCNSVDKTVGKSRVMHRSVDTVKLAIQKAFSEKAQFFGLAPIGKGVDSFELRLWISSILVESDLVTLSYTNSSWRAHKIRYYKSPDGVTHFKEEKIKNDILLALLVDSLKLIDFANMISQEEIPNFVDNVADGVTYDLEIATKGNYELITYHCPERFAETEINNKRFLELVYLLDKYFHFWSPICSP